MYYTSSHLPESGGQLLITSLTHNKKIPAADSISTTDIVLVYLLVYVDCITIHYEITKHNDKNMNNRKSSFIHPFIEPSIHPLICLFLHPFINLFHSSSSNCLGSKKCVNELDGIS